MGILIILIKNSYTKKYTNVLIVQNPFHLKKEKPSLPPSIPLLT